MTLKDIKLRTRSFLLTIGSISLFLVVVEGLLHIFGPFFAPAVVRIESGGYQFLPNLHAAKLDAESGLLLRFDTNSHGALDREWSKAELLNSKKIAIIGNSFVAAQQMRRRNRFTNILEQRLNEGTQPYIVMNFGVDGQNIINFLDRTRAIKKTFDPDLVVIAIHNASNFNHDQQTTFVGNTRIDITTTNDKVEITSTPLVSRIAIMKRWVKKILRQLWLVRVAHNGYIHVTEKVSQIFHTSEKSECFPAITPNKQFTQRAFLVTGKVLSEIRKLLNNRVLILQVPDEKQVFPSVNYNCDWEQPERWLKEFSNSKGIPFLQLLKPLRNTAAPTYFPLGHLNQLGNEVVAEEMRKKIMTIFSSQKTPRTSAPGPSPSP